MPKKSPEQKAEVEGHNVASGVILAKSEEL